MSAHLRNLGGITRVLYAITALLAGVLCCIAVGRVAATGVDGVLTGEPSLAVYSYDALAHNAVTRLVVEASSADTKQSTNARAGEVYDQLVSATGVATETAGGIADDVVLARGGANTADRFAAGSGVTTDSAGNLHQVSVNSGRTVEEAAQGIPHNQIGVSTAGDVRAAGGSVVRNPLPGNPGHCLVGGLTAETLSELFTPTIKNPCR